MSAPAGGIRAQRAASTRDGDDRDYGRAPRPGGGGGRGQSGKGCLYCLRPRVARSARVWRCACGCPRRLHRLGRTRARWRTGSNRERSSQSSAGRSSPALGTRAWPERRQSPRWGLRVHPVLVVDVDVICAEPLQRPLDCDAEVQLGGDGGRERGEARLQSLEPRERLPSSLLGRAA